MCFAPQRRALFQHLNFQKCSEPLSVLRATPCTFSHLNFQKCSEQFLTLLLPNVLCATTPHLNFQNCSEPLSFEHFYFQICFAPQRRALVQHLNFQKCSEPLSFDTFYFQICFAPQRSALFRHLNFQKCSEIFTVYFQMCFGPQRRALFRHLNFQNCSELFSFVTHFQICFGPQRTSQLPKVLRTPQFLTHFTSKSASRHNAVHFFNISTSKSGPTLRCFVPFHFEIGFAPQRRATFHLSSPQMSPHPPL